MRDIIAVIASLGGLGISGVIVELIRKNSNKSSYELKEQFEKINRQFEKMNGRIDFIEEIQIGQSRVVKKNLILSLLSEWDKASDEARPWIADKINYEFEHYREPPINGNSWVEEALKQRNLI